MSNWYLKAVGRLAAAIGESDRYSAEHLQWLRSGYACQHCGTTLVKARGNTGVRCYDDQGKRVGLLLVRLRGKIFECLACNHQWTFRNEHSNNPTTFLGRFIKLYVRACIAIVVLMASFIGTYLAVHAQRIFPAAESVVIYGRDSCGFTAAMRADLDERAIPYIYADIDNSLVREEMWHHLARIGKPGDIPHTAHLPVVLINHQVLERPDSAFVIGQRTLASHR
jgi:glutaredoxin